MSLKDFRVVDNLGKGSFASVYKVIRKSDNKVYALKKVKINKMSKKEIADALNEIRFLASIRQKNIVGFLEAFLENNETELCIVMEYCGCGDLAQKVERYKRRKSYIDEDVIWRYLIQALKALEYIHERNICHRDIKTANSFLAEDGSVKMGDMNVSKKLKRGQLQTQIGTPYYMSPEIWNNRPYDASSDIWSLGCMIYELSALKPPFNGTDFPSLKRAVTAGRYSSIPRKYSEALGKTIAKMLKVSARDRPSAAALLKSDLLAPKLHLDEGASSGVSFVSAENNRQQLLQTIMVPQNLRQLNRVLPKPCYPSDKSTAESADAAPPAAPPAPPVPPPAEKRAKEPRVDKENKNNCGHQPSSKQHANPSRPTAPSKPTSNIPGVPYSARPGRQHNHAPSSRYGQHAQGAPESNNNPYGVPVHHAAHQHHNYGQHPNYGHQHHGKAGVQSRVQSHRIW